MKMVGYKCKKCDKQVEELFQDTENPPKHLDVKCECGGTFEKWDYKNNPHRWNFNDRGGI